MVSGRAAMRWPRCWVCGSWAWIAVCRSLVSHHMALTMDRRSRCGVAVSWWTLSRRSHAAAACLMARFRSGSIWWPRMRSTVRWYAIHLGVSCSSGALMGGSVSWSTSSDGFWETCSTLSCTSSGRCPLAFDGRSWYCARASPHALGPHSISRCLNPSGLVAGVGAKLGLVWRP